MDTHAGLAVEVDDDLLATETTPIAVRAPRRHPPPPTQQSLRILNRSIVRQGETDPVDERLEPRTCGGVDNFVRERRFCSRVTTVRGGRNLPWHPLSSCKGDED